MGPAETAAITDKTGPLSRGAASAPASYTNNGRPRLRKERNDQDSHDRAGLATTALPAAAGGFNDGNEILASFTKSNNTYCIGYVIGVVDYTGDKCLSGKHGVIAKQMVDVTIDYLKRHQKNAIW